MNVDEALTPERSDEVHRLLAAEVRQLRAALTEIRDMHQIVDDDPAGPPYCAQCDADGYPDPCRTFAIARKALDR